MSRIRLYDLTTFEPLGYLEAFDLDANEGRGSVTITHDENEAMVFANPAVAMEAWRAPSKKFPVRPDGKPNRPLTAYSAEIL